MTTSILDEAAAAIIERDKTHGYYEDNQLLTSLLWSAYIAAGNTPDLQPHDVCILNILQKISRMRCGNLDRDHLVDIAGWAELAARLTEPGSST